MHAQYSIYCGSIPLGVVGHDNDEVDLYMHVLIIISNSTSTFAPWNRVKYSTVLSLIFITYSGGLH